MFAILILTVSWLDLNRDGHEERYLQLLRDSFNPATVDGLMCLRQIVTGEQCFGCTAGAGSPCGGTIV